MNNEVIEDHYLHKHPQMRPGNGYTLPVPPAATEEPRLGYDDLAGGRNIDLKKFFQADLFAPDEDDREEYWESGDYVYTSIWSEDCVGDPELRVLRAKERIRNAVNSKLQSNRSNLLQHLQGDWVIDWAGDGYDIRPVISGYVTAFHLHVSFSDWYIEINPSYADVLRAFQMGFEDGTCAGANQVRQAIRNNLGL